MQSPKQSISKGTANVFSTPSRTFSRSESGPAATTPSQQSTGDRSWRRLSSFTSPRSGRDKSLTKRSYSSGDYSPPSNSPPFDPVSIPITPGGGGTPPRFHDHSPPRDIRLPASEYELSGHKQDGYATSAPHTYGGAAPTAANFMGRVESVPAPPTSTPHAFVSGAQMSSGQLPSHGPMLSHTTTSSHAYPQSPYHSYQPYQQPGPPADTGPQHEPSSSSHRKLSPGIGLPPPQLSVPPPRLRSPQVEKVPPQEQQSMHYAPPPHPPAAGEGTGGAGRPPHSYAPPPPPTASANAGSGGTRGFSSSIGPPPPAVSGGNGRAGWEGNNDNPSRPTQQKQQQRQQLSSMQPQQYTTAPGDAVRTRKSRSPPRSRIDSNQMPRPRPADPNAPELIYHTRSSSGARKVPPASTAVFTCVDSGIATPRAVRVTSVAPPATKAISTKIAMPLAVTATPFAMPENDECEVSLVDMRTYGSEEGNPPRCVKCRAYINPYVGWTQGGTKWTCNMCGATNITESW